MFRGVAACVISNPLEDVDEACRGIIAAISSSEYFHLYGPKIEALHFKSEALKLGAPLMNKYRL